MQSLLVVQMRATRSLAHGSVEERGQLEGVDMGNGERLNFFVE